MPRINFLIQSLLLISVIFFMSCGNTNLPNAKTIEKDNIKNTEVPTQTVESKPDSKQELKPNSEVKTENGTFNITAKFLEFSLGDASHYLFEDGEGKTYDFGRCEADSYIFHRELGESEMNSDNQGFGSNKELKGKWFDITYYEEEQPLYIDGPMGTVKIISKVTVKK